jgi:hypothetical protein
MKTYPLHFTLIFCLVSFFWSCSNEPKVIAPKTTQSNEDSEIFSPEGQPMTSEFAEHKIKAKEILNTERYTYMFVEEEGTKDYWIAISNRKVEVGDQFIYRGGLMKKNFFSTEFNREFESILLVGEILPLNTQVSSDQIDIKAPKKVEIVEGAIKLKDLITKSAEYSGKKVRVTGKCVKINPLIMGKNWIHIQDESGSKFDLTITTTQNVQLGQIVSLEGTLGTNRDFGAGYFYKVILEDAIIL